MTYSSDTPISAGFYMGRGFRLNEHTGERETDGPQWEYPFTLFYYYRSNPPVLQYRDPVGRIGDVDDLGIYKNTLGLDFRHYDVEWARIPTPANPTQHPNP